MPFDFTMIDEDHCIYVKKSNRNFVILSLYIDDILLAGNNLEYVKTVKSWLSKSFDMKDMGEADYILGVKIQRDRSKNFLSLFEETYIKKILERFRMNSCKLMDTLIARGETLSLEMCPKTEKEKEDMSRVPYSSVVGSLLYAMMCARPDICYAASLVSRYQFNPGRDHWKAVKRIFRYLKGTTDYTLCYSGFDLFIRCYTYVDWASDRNDRKSTSSYAFLLNGGAISWKIKKKTCITLSTMESEFVACVSLVQEIVWSKRFFEHLSIAKDSMGLLILNCDSQAAITYTKDPKYHSKTKHIDIKYNFVRDVVPSGEITLQYIPTCEMIADPFTKAISRDLFEKHVKALGLRRV